MSKLILYILSIACCFCSYGQEDFKKEFIKDLNDKNLEDGCKIVVYVVDAGLNAACFIPEPSLSKVACAAAKVLNIGMTSSFDPNISNPIQEAGVKICQFSYVTTEKGVTYIFDFASQQSKEIEETWNWLNSLEGGLFFMDYIKR